MKNLDTIHLDIEDNEEVSDLFSGCKAGHTVKISLEATITEHTEDRIAASVDGIEEVEKVGDYDDDDDDESEDNEDNEDNDEEGY